MKRYQAVLVGAVIATVIYNELSKNEQLEQIQETVVETREIVEDIATSLVNTPYDLSDDYHCLASNIYWESRNQSLSGQVAVGQVVLNRVDNKRFPDTICNVVKQARYYPSGNIDLHDCQFSWYCDGKSDVPLEKEKEFYEDAFYLAVELIEDRPMDITEGATHYHSNKVNPYWADSLKRVTRIDDHIFYRR